eukprot:453219-Alexandrium_andersonii.AAC.1
MRTLVPGSGRGSVATWTASSSRRRSSFSASAMQTACEGRMLIRSAGRTARRPTRSGPRSAGRSA